MSSKVQNKVILGKVVLPELKISTLSWAQGDLLGSLLLMYVKAVLEFLNLSCDLKIKESMNSK